MTNDLIMQAFEWYLPADSKHWQKLQASIPELQKLGISKIWLPPAFKGTGTNDVGYGIYDLFDLGEFDQNGTVPTKYGSKEEYLSLVSELNKAGIQPIADVVLNHKANADQKETFYVLKMNPENRQEPISEPYEIEGWTGFNFPGRKNKYNNFKWHWYHFSGLDYDARNNETGIYLIAGDNKGWADQETVDNEKGNFDYLMFNDIDFKHPEVRQHLKDWTKWYISESQVKGFRLDAIKHIDASFMKEFITFIQAEIYENFYIFGEYWKDDFDETEHYLELIDYKFDLFDVALHMNFYQACQAGNNFDMRQIFDGSLVQTHPMHAITFVENHDTQKGQSLQSNIEDWFKPIAYSLVMLRQDGLPCVFYGDYYGIEGDDFGQPSFKNDLDKLAFLRKEFAYGQEVDYFDHANCIGWTRLGDDEHQSALAVVVSNGDKGWKHMEVGQLYAGQTFVDYMGNSSEEMTIDENGWADFHAQAGSVSAWVPKNKIK
ncbi:alpha-amylase [Streptococcus parauberis]|uniref:alpha-amylase n=1 Tax=Streptococcus parauberis TaxID=1348 RepID=UPI0037BB4AEE